MKIAYVTAQTPFGPGEAFILEEMLAVTELGVNLLIIPRNPSKEVFHKEGERLLGNTVWLPLLDKRIFFNFLKALLSRPHVWSIIGTIFHRSRTWKIAVKNLAILPKAVFVADLLLNEGVEHIHAHWGSTTATMAWIISELTGIPWSITLHRWDIKENNMLEEKIRSAKFVRCISENGRDELFNTIGRKYENRVKVIHMGVRIPDNRLEPKTHRDVLRIVTPANLLEVKGHKFLIEACSILIERGVDGFQCVFYGEGPLKGILVDMIKDGNLTEHIKLPGVIPHNELIEMYENHEIDIVVLPSITTVNGEHEGIPVALMEAMAAGVPVISTTTGGIPELLDSGAGILVPPEDSEALADAIQLLMEDSEMRFKVGAKGREKVEREFAISCVAKKLVSLFAQQ
ncbi:MAG TPA: glycosyltransferase family 4 protein [Fervidobacterium sp.]|nr:glycosyltransferase family 4 protein [Fervidobacterium sp.]